MSVLINMEMPTSCGECKAFVCYRQWAGDSGDCFCGITKSDAKVGARNADCPIVPVAPHGRLIDADALLKHKGDCYDRDGHLLYAVGTGNIMCAPTIIPAEPCKEKGE